MRKFPYYLVTVTIFKNEAVYVGEWLEYHLMVGVDKFFLYDNDSDDGPISVLCPYIQSGLVNYTIWPGLVQQLPAYQFALANLRRVAFWVAFIDVDEFIDPVSDKSIPAILHRFEDTSALVMYWLVFGSGGQMNRTDGLVIERFVDYGPLEDEWSHIVKSIVNPRAVTRMGVHEAVFRNRASFARDCRRTALMKWRPWDLRTALHNCIHVNHYWTKSYDEWTMKRQRGRAMDRAKRNNAMYRLFGKRFGNTDKSMKKYVRVVKKRLAGRKREKCKMGFPGKK
jgi:hypothetical protein